MAPIIDYGRRRLGKGSSMRWVLTAIVLSSVSLLVVTLTVEDGQAFDPRSHVTISRRRTLLHLLVAARTLAVSAGHVLGAGARIAAAVAVVVGERSVALGRRAVTTMEARLRSRGRGLAGPQTASGTARGRPLKFEQCLQMTGPEFAVSDVGTRSALVIAPMPRRNGWLSRVLSVLELVVVILAVGGAIALALIAVGWKAAHVF